MTNIKQAMSTSQSPTLKTSELEEWEKVADIGRHIVNETFPVYPTLTTLKKITNASKIQKTTLQTALQNHVELLTPYIQEEGKLSTISCDIPMRKQLLQSLQRPLCSSFVLAEQRGNGAVLRSCAGNYFLVRGHSKPLSLELAHLPPVFSVALFPCPFGGITYSGLPQAASKQQTRKLCRFVKKPVPASATVHWEAVDNDLWSRLRVEEDELMDVGEAHAHPHGANLADMYGWSQTSSNAGVFAGFVNCYDPARNATYQGSVENKLSLDDACPCDGPSGKPYRDCHKPKGQLPICTLTYPAVNIELGKVLARGEDAMELATTVINSVLSKWPLRAENYQMNEHRQLVFQIEDFHNAMECLLSQGELYFRPYGTDDNFKASFLLCGYIQLRAPPMARGSSAGHSLSTVEDRFKRKNIGPRVVEKDPENPIHFFGCIDLEHGPGKMIVAANCWSQYKHLLRILKDSGAAQFLSKGSVARLDKAITIRTTGSSSLGASESSGRSGKSALKRLEAASKCARCGRGNSGEALKACSRCKKVWYCGQECQKADWKAKHKKECVPKA